MIEQMIEEIVKTIEKSWGVNSIGCPFGSVNEKFSNEKMIEIAIKNKFPEEIVKLLKENPVRFPQNIRFDNGRTVGRHFAKVVKDYGKGGICQA